MLFIQRKNNAYKNIYTILTLLFTLNKNRAVSARKTTSDMDTNYAAERTEHAWRSHNQRH